MDTKNNNGIGHHTLGLSLLNVLYRHRRSVNDTQATEVDSRSEIERFYDDPNNKAMFLVFPVFVLIICSCCGLYFCDKARKHFKKKKAEKKKRENAAKDEEANESGIEDHGERFPRELNQADSVKESEEITGIPMTDNVHCSSPLEDVENSPEVSAVNAIPIKHTETSFMTDVRQANTYNVNVTLHNKMSKNTSAISTNIGSQNLIKNAETTSEKQGNSESDMNANVVFNNSRPTSTQSIRSMQNNSGHVKKKVQITESEDPSTKNVKAMSETTIANNTTSDVTTPITEINKTQKWKGRQRDNFNSVSPTETSNVSIHSETLSNRTVPIHGRTSPPDVTKRNKYPKIDRTFSRLSAEAIGEILQYYKDKKHMPDIIPDEHENLVPIKKRNKRGKYHVFNG